MLSGQTVLVVEAEFLIALDFQRMLEELGAGQMLFARTSAEVHRLPVFDLALVEIRLDDSNWPATTRALREHNVPLILVTASSAIRNGHPDFPGVPILLKPVSETDLAVAIAAVLRPAT